MILTYTCVVIAVIGPVLSVDWSYSGANGPEHWPENFETCRGQKQSPIDINKWTFDEELGQFELENYDSSLDDVVWSFDNNGHSATMLLDSSGYSASGGGLPGVYKAAQFHFHWGSDDSHGSEHQVEGNTFPMELHIVHFNADRMNLTNALKYPDGLAVMGVFFEISAQDNDDLQPLISELANIRDEHAHVDVPAFPLTNMMPGDLGSFYRYSGSLTTPTCDEVVVWTLFRDPVKISSSQMAEFRKLQSHGHDLQDNYRPVQDLNGRTIKSSFESSAPKYGSSIFLVTAVVAVSVACGW